MDRTYLPQSYHEYAIQTPENICSVIRVAIFLIDHVTRELSQSRQPSNDWNAANQNIPRQSTQITVMEMDEAPTSSTSLRAGRLHISQDPKQVLGRRYHRRTSSFPTALFFKTSLSLNLFRKNKDRSPEAPTKASNKANPEPDETASNTEEEEPYEVAPGIWSNEATAKVFGYLDNPSSQTKGKRHRRKKRSESTEPSLHQRKNRSPSPVEGLAQSNNVTRPEYDRLASSSWRTVGRHTEESLKTVQGRTDQVAGAVGEVEAQTIRGRVRDASIHRRTRTVSREDTLVARGANPRTGVVSPYATSESAESGYMTRGRREETAGWRDMKTKNGSRMERTASGMWMQDIHGWSLVGSRAMTPVAQSVRPGMEGRRSSVPIGELQDRSVANMPNAKKPTPVQLSREQIEAYHRSVAKACHDVGGSHALVDPETVPTPKVMTPEGPSTPPRRLEKIRRKEVGSALSQRKGSTDTVIIHSQARASSMPTPRKEPQRQFRARVISPGNTVLDVSKQSAGYGNGFESQGDPFLGVCQDARSYQTNATPSLSFQTRYTENHQYQLNHLESIETTDTVAYVQQPPSQTLSQRLPPVNLVHPRQASIPRSKPPNQNSNLVRTVPLPTTISTAITTPITTTTTPLHPCLPRLDGTDSGQPANLPHDHLPKRRVPKVRFQPAPPATSARGNDSTSGPHPQGISEPRSQEKSGMPLSLVAGYPQRPKTAPNQNASTYASGSHPLPYLCQKADLDLDLGSELRMRRGQRSASGPAMRGVKREPFRPIMGNGNGDIHTGGKTTGESIGVTSDGTEAEALKLRTLADKGSIVHTNIAGINASFPDENHAPLSKTLRADPSSSGAQFGESADSCLSPTATTTTTDPDPGVNIHSPTATAHSPPSLLTTLHALRDAAHLLERNLHFSFSRFAADTFLSLLHMNQHVLATLHPSSKTMEVLTFAKKEQQKQREQEQGVGLEEWVKAVRDVVLAVVYLVVLGGVLGVVGRLLGWVCGCVAGVWAFGRGLLGVGRWLLGV